MPYKPLGSLMMNCPICTILTHTSFFFFFAESSLQLCVHVLQLSAKVKLAAKQLAALPWTPAFARIQFDTVQTILSTSRAQTLVLPDQVLDIWCCCYEHLVLQLLWPQRGTTAKRPSAECYFSCREQREPSGITHTIDVNKGALYFHARLWGKDSPTLSTNTFGISKTPGRIFEGATNEATLHHTQNYEGRGASNTKCFKCLSLQL